MYLSHHIIITSIIYIITYFFLGNPFLVIPFFIGAVLIDFDHCFDYYLRYRKPVFSIKKLGDGLAPYKHFIVPLHSYEFAIYIVGLTIILPNTLMISFLAGYLLHMFLDIVFNRYESIEALSLAYRITYWWNDVCSNTA